jgi:hypothetical protein
VEVKTLVDTGKSNILNIKIDMIKLIDLLNESLNSIIELNTSFLQSQDDFKRGGDEGYTVWKPEFKNGLKANQQNFK